MIFENPLRRGLGICLLVIVLSGCAGSRFTNADDTGELRKISSLRELQGTYINQAINHDGAANPGPDAQLSFSFFSMMSNEKVNGFYQEKPSPAFVRIVYVSEQQLQLQAFNAQGAFIEAKTLAAPQDFTFRDGKLVTLSKTIDQNKSTDYGKAVTISFTLNERGNLVKAYTQDGAGMYLYVVPSVSKVRLNHEFQRYSN